jgi:hypothetical protein
MDTSFEHKNRWEYFCKTMKYSHDPITKMKEFFEYNNYSIADIKSFDEAYSTNDCHRCCNIIIKELQNELLTFWTE